MSTTAVTIANLAWAADLPRKAPLVAPVAPPVQDLVWNLCRRRRRLWVGQAEHRFYSGGRSASLCHRPVCPRPYWNTTGISYFLSRSSHPVHKTERLVGRRLLRCTE